MRKASQYIESQVQTYIPGKPVCPYHYKLERLNSIFHYDTARRDLQSSYIRVCTQRKPRCHVKRARHAFDH